jgi:DENN (AEX-3) domain/dDENN domain/uDENN domain
MAPSNSNSSSINNTGKNGKRSSGNKRGVHRGVADYYAILGVGESLTWKHAQKQHSQHQQKQQQQQQTQQGDIVFTSPFENEADESMEQERFLREIVHVKIVMSLATANAATTSDDHHHPDSAETSHEGSSHKDGSVIQTAPSYRSEESSISSAYPLQPYHPPSQVRVATANHEEDALEGWTVIASTLPTAAAGYARAQSQTDPKIQIWNPRTVWSANLDWNTGLYSDIAALQKQADDIIVRQRSAKVEITKIKQKIQFWQSSGKNLGMSSSSSSRKNFHVAYLRRDSLQCDTPAVADVQLWYVRLHRAIVPADNNTGSTPKSRTVAGMLAGQLWKGYQSQQALPASDTRLVPLKDYLPPPPSFSSSSSTNSFDEWSIPEPYQFIQDPADPYATRTILLANSGCSSGGNNTSIAAHDDVEAVQESAADLALFLPRLLSSKDLVSGNIEVESAMFCTIPILAIRRQRLGEEERYREDAGLTDIVVSIYNRDGTDVLPVDEDDEDGDEEEDTFQILGKTDWHSVQIHHSLKKSHRAVPSQVSHMPLPSMFGMPVLLQRKNIPFGFADAAFATRVMGRFPFENYKGLPLPEEELPMFCYPTGCRLHRAKLSDAPLPQYYGFVVKNERGDNIHVSCVSFMEPLTASKVDQLARMSEQRRRTSLPHRLFCNKRDKRRRLKLPGIEASSSGESSISASSTDLDSSCLLTAFEDMTTFENKTICVVSRYPYWTPFRKFLSHLHVLAGSSADLPLERWISHLLLSVRLPLPGGPSTVIPLPALNEPMVFSLPPEKDFPLVDLPYHRLFACLDIKTTVSIVLGLLVLERKVIIMSTRPSLVLDVCELLRSLLFPFELCAPYVPRLTEPFKSSLDFPGAIFVGIHDDGEPHGLATKVKKMYPEDSIVIDLDSGQMDCDGDRSEALAGIWNTIPTSSRSILVSELETLCRDANIVDGQEPLDSLFDSAFYVDLPDVVEGFGIASESREPLDNRGVRDAFLRFFCSMLGGYERFLVVPDADFLISGNEWFDAKGFLASVPSERSAYLNNLVSTQLFQSFIQRRTEASDVHCLLFDECITEFHSTSIPYGRLGGDVEAVHSPNHSQPQMLYSLLVDQCAATTVVQEQGPLSFSRSIDVSDTDSSLSLNLSKASASIADSSTKHSEAITTNSGEFITSPSNQGLPVGKRYIHCVDGNPCFPYVLNMELLLPQNPASLEIAMSKPSDPLLARSEKELEEASRRRRMATTYRGLQNQRRCLWQLPKLMGSHFLGAWLLCTPNLVSRHDLTDEQQSRFLLRALGALRLLRSKQRIVPDEAAYRALMVACGRARSDRRVELVKIFGLLRSDGIFPSAVTLGQYTKGLAEGYSKRSSGNCQDDGDGIEVAASGSREFSLSSVGQPSSLSLEICLLKLDTTLQELEYQGKRWRSKQSQAQGYHDFTDSKKKRSKSKSWLPVAYSSSFVPAVSGELVSAAGGIELLSMWSRTRSCPSCCYVPLEEEIQAGWDIVGGENEVPGAVACPRCDSFIVPMLGYRIMSISESLDSEKGTSNSAETSDILLPDQISPLVNTSDTSAVNFVAYVSPACLRAALEQFVEEHGEEALYRGRLKQMDPELLYNLWWYCARFSLPLPLAIETSDSHACAFVAWDRSTAERGCYSAAKVLKPLFDSRESMVTDLAASSNDTGPNESFDDAPLLSRFNLQGFNSTVWDHPDLSKLLVTLVDACDKRDFKTVVESALQWNQRRREELGPQNDIRSDISLGTSIALSSNSGYVLPSVELDVYRVILYLAKYECTTAFHTFFPATLKPCKGYHFWCATGTPLPIFDRLLRDAVRRLTNNKERTHFVHVPDVSDVALGFRCVFGHLI